MPAYIREFGNPSEAKSQIDNLDWWPRMVTSLSISTIPIDSNSPMTLHAIRAFFCEINLGIRQMPRRYPINVAPRVNDGNTFASIRFIPIDQA